MNQFLDRFQKLPRSQRWLVAAVGYAAVLAIFYFLMISPNLQAMDAANAEHTRLTGERNKVRARAENLETFQKEFEILQAKLARALKELPNDREIPGLLSEIDSLARKSGLEVRKFQPLPEVVHEFYAEVPVQMVMNGGYHEFGIFFDRVSKMSRIVSVTDIRMGDPRDVGPEVELNTNGRIVTFRFLTEEEIKKNQERNKAAPGGGGGGGE